MNKLSVYLSIVIVLILSISFFFKVEKLNSIRSIGKFNFQIPVIKPLKREIPKGTDYVGLPSVWGFKSNNIVNGDVVSKNGMVAKSEKRRANFVYLKKRINGIPALCKKGFKSSCILFFGLVFKKDKSYVILYNTETKRIGLFSSNEAIVDNLTIFKILSNKIKVKSTKGTFLINLFGFPKEKGKNKTTPSKNLP